MIAHNESQIAILKECGRIAKQALSEGMQAAEAGVSTLEINNVVEKTIRLLKGTPSFLGYATGDGSYPFATCTPVNYQLVHTLPSDKVILKVGDILTLDLGVFYGGFHTDVAHTIEIESSKNTRFLMAGKKALEKGLSATKAGNRVGDISFELQRVIESYGFNVSVDLVGHGIGKNLHEPPQIPCFGKKRSGELLEKGHVLAVEVMYMAGESGLVLGKDGFSLETRDKSLSAQFEHTLLVTDSAPLILA